MEWLPVSGVRATEERGHLLVAQPDVRLAVSDVSVVHLVAEPYVRQAASTAGAAATSNTSTVAMAALTPLTFCVIQSHASPSHLLPRHMDQSCSLCCCCYIGFGVTTAAFVTGTLREVSVAMVGEMRFSIKGFERVGDCSARSGC
jgi:hypothetical protein